MNEARKLGYHQPKFMAVEKERRGDKEQNGNKKLKINTTILLTWLAVIALTAFFWFLIIRLF